MGKIKIDIDRVDNLQQAFMQKITNLDIKNEENNISRTELPSIQLASEQLGEISAIIKKIKETLEQGLEKVETSKVKVETLDKDLI